MSKIFGYMFVNLEKKRRLFDIVNRLREIKKILEIYFIIFKYFY